MTETENSMDRARARLRWPLRLTLAGLLAERGVRAFWPLWTLAFVMIAARAFALAEHVPLDLARGAVVLWALALAWFTVSGLRRFRWPRRAEVWDRLDATLPGRPLSALGDRQAVGAGDDGSAEVWRAHLGRMAARTAMARAPRPDLRLAARDPYALRYVALSALVLALVFGSVWRVGEIGNLAPAPLRLDAQAPGTAWEAWVQPPAYTGRPSLYLNEVDRAGLSVPMGSRVSVRLYGESGVLTMSESVSGRGASDDPAAPSHDFEIVRSGQVNVEGPGGRGWEITVQDDAAPRIRFSDAISREARGAMRQPFAASDDYGVVGGSAEITLDLDSVDRRHGLARDPEPREPIVVDLPMPVAGDRSDFEEALIENFSRHPWSNLPVTIRLSARDARDQVGRSAVREVALPGRRFFDPMAAALIEMRRDLLWNRDNARRVAQVLRAVSHRPEDAFRIERAYLMLRVALRQLEAGLPGGVSAELRDEVAEALWEVALLVEEGDLADALERLRRAQDRLSEAMRNGADDTEIAELMDELRDAMRDYIRQLAEQQSEDDGERDFAEGESREVTGDQLQQMMDRIQELMEQGRMDEAMELMNQLAMMMENMRVVEGEGSQGEGGPGEQAMEGLGEALRGQQDLSDQTFRELQEQFGQRGFGGQQDFGMAPPRADEPGGRQPGEQDGDGSGAGAGRDPGGGDGLAPGDEGLAERQRALREQLRELEDAPLPGSGGEDGDAARESMEDAGRAMERAEEALREGDGAGALSGQADAIDALRESMRQIGEQVARERGERGEGGGSEFGEAGPDSRRDPLGRDLSRFGQIGTEQNLLDGGEVRNRARELLDEIRRRSGEQDRPELELDYLRRLLERF